MKVAKWGNSLAIRLPATVVADLDLKEGDEITVSRGSGTTPDLVVDKQPDREAIIRSLRKYRGIVPADYKFDRDEANERG